MGEFGSNYHTLGDFEILAKLGQGGMGAVYKARQRSLDRLVALKILPPKFNNDYVFIERFQREARACAKLNHPNIVQGIDVGCDADSGRWYFAMELIEGPSLKQILNAEKKIPEARVIQIARDIASALECAHKNGFVHRDIKPDNILIAPDGTAKLADLGLARQVSGNEVEHNGNSENDWENPDGMLTSAGQMLGTPAYMPPEQILGEREKIDIRSDIYSLGATLFHLVTGRPPYSGSSSGVIMSNHLTEEIPFANQFAPSVSERFSQLIAEMMQKERENRIQSPEELRARIAKLDSPARSALRPARKRPTSPQILRPELNSWLSDPRTVMAIVTMVILSLIIVVLLFTQSNRVNEANSHSKPNQNDSMTSSLPTPPIAPTEKASEKLQVSPIQTRVPESDDEILETLATRKLMQLKKHQLEEHSEAVVRNEFTEFVAKYGSTNAGKGAADILNKMPVPAASQVVKSPDPIAKPLSSAPSVPDKIMEPIPSDTRKEPRIQKELDSRKEATHENDVAYLDVLYQAYDLIRSQQFTAGADLLKKALARPDFNNLTDEIDRDIRCAGLAENAVRASKEGATRLAAQNREFSIWRLDGKEIKTGGDSKRRIAAVKESIIEIEENLGGGVATSKVKLEQVAPRTVYDLARIGLPESAESNLKLAAWGATILSNGTDYPAARDLSQLLDSAQSSNDLVEHLRARIALFQKEIAAVLEFKRIEVLIKGKQWDAAMAALISFRKEYFGTRALKRVLLDVEKQLAQVESELHILKPGLWASFWALDSKTKLLVRVEPQLRADYGMGSPDPAVPNDRFRQRMGGILRVERDGRYVFKLSADDYVGLYIDGKLLGEAGTFEFKSVDGAELKLTQEVEVTLSKGDHSLKVEYKEVQRLATFAIDWKPPGEGTSAVPNDLLWHDPKKVDEYEREP